MTVVRSVDEDKLPVGNAGRQMMEVRWSIQGAYFQQRHLAFSIGFSVSKAPSRLLTMDHGPWTMDPCIHGSMVPWIHGSMDPWIHGSLERWIHGSMETIQ